MTTTMVHFFGIRIPQHFRLPTEGAMPVQLTTRCPQVLSAFHLYRVYGTHGHLVHKAFLIFMRSWAFNLCWTLILENGISYALGTDKIVHEGPLTLSPPLHRAFRAVIVHLRWTWLLYCPSSSQSIALVVYVSTGSPLPFRSAAVVYYWILGQSVSSITAAPKLATEMRASGTQTVSILVLDIGLKSEFNRLKCLCLIWSESFSMTVPRYLQFFESLNDAVRGQ